MAEILKGQGRGLASGETRPFTGLSYLRQRAAWWRSCVSRPEEIELPNLAAHTQVLMKSGRKPAPDTPGGWYGEVRTTSRPCMTKFTHQPPFSWESRSPATPEGAPARLSENGPVRFHSSGTCFLALETMPIFSAQPHESF